ncbi:M42 family metallopeptidase [Risungbinella massiliensis]|uniref:M42 family metallopeptidase n=1 Tax=Risungbinella massiliensis TaxID=1329796 RepID=UPI0005CB9F66|nr:M42 family metallopeptidase [Risungbinella massiliensis]
MINWNRMKQLTQAAGAPGYENPVRSIMEQELSLLSENVISDHLGSIFGIKTGFAEGPKVMVAGHLDEVSFMVTGIRSDGLLVFNGLGGWWSQTLPSQRVQILTRSGKLIPAVISATPPHALSAEQRKKPIPMKKMFLDVGARSKEDVEEFGIRLGDVAIPDGPYQELEGGYRILSKAWDNRFGCGMSLELLEDLQDQVHPNVVYAGATVQEEVGVRGAATASNLVEPDVFFAVDVGPAAGDIPGKSDGFGKIGKGVLIRLYDRSMITSPQMRDFLLDTAEEENIPYQVFVSPGGGTDAGRVHLMSDGIPSAAIGICGRYIHSHSTIIDKEDAEATKVFLKALIKRLDKSVYETLLSR